MAMAEGKQVRLRIKRQSGPQAAAHWEDFSLPHRPGMNVIVALMDIAARPVTAQGQATTSVSYEANCLEEVCGACAMIINGRPRQACSALIDRLDQPITLEPLSRFPVVRDLVVSRQRLFNDLKRVRAWIPIDGSYDLGPGPKEAPADQEVAYPLSRCISCGNCLEVCPQYNDKTGFVGAAVISQVRLFNLHPTGKMHARERLDALAAPGGIQECGYAQNCVNICPKDIPLTDSISAVGRQMIAHVVRQALGQ
jgi:succinate dehydrogenase / fumarate reductase iron-sulfur subunit